MYSARATHCLDYNGLMFLRNHPEMAASQQNAPSTVLEFYSGSGGMHYALKEAVSGRVVVASAFYINTTVNSS